MRGLLLALLGYVDDANPELAGRGRGLCRKRYVPVVGFSRHEHGPVALRVRIQRYRQCSR